MYVDMANQHLMIYNISYIERDRERERERKRERERETVMNWRATTTLYRTE